MQCVEEAEAIAGVGLAGDRYATGCGYYSPRNVCQLTLIEAEALERMRARYGVSVANGEHRRNLVVRGLALPELAGRRFTLGEVLVEYVRSRPPCAYLGRLSSPLLPRAMGEGAGICVNILTGGRIRVGDPIVLAEGKSSATRPKLP